MSGLCREVITLQLGHYSNFVGTHWWNLQVTLNGIYCYLGHFANTNWLGVNLSFLLLV